MAWFGSEKNALSEEAAYEMDMLSLELNAFNATDYSSAPAISGDSSEAMPEIEALELLSVSDSVSEMAAEPELELEGFTPPEEVADEMDELSLELTTSETTESLSVEASTDVVTDDADEDEAVTAEHMNAVIDSVHDLEADEDAAVCENETRPLSAMANVLSSRSSNTGELSRRTRDSLDPEKIFFNPDEYVIGLVLKGVAEAKESGAIAKLTCLLDRIIYIDARNKRVSSNLKDIHMRQLAIAPLSSGDSDLDAHLEMIESTSMAALTCSDSAIYPLETFIWELALLTSKGRVPMDTPMDKPTYLMQWPNFTRLMQSPNDMKIAAYWLRLPSSLIDLSENLNVPINDVRLLYSAACLSGLAGVATRKSDNMLLPGKPEKHQNRNLFGFIMNKFRK
jgi:hypothetical protein